MKIKSKQQIIEHFISGNKPDQFIGVENEKFLFKKKSNERADYSDLLKIFNFFISKFNYLVVNYLIFMKSVPNHMNFKKN